jgi:hypothetical protein
MKLSVTEFAMHKQNESPILGKNLTLIKLDDLGSGYFIKIVQYGDGDVNEIQLNFEDIEFVVKAIEMLREGTCKC